MFLRVVVYCTGEPCDAKKCAEENIVAFNSIAPKEQIPEERWVDINDGKLILSRAGTEWKQSASDVFLPG